jgi:hypothetical protein
MPKQKDLKRLVRTRMEKTGEAYTAARLHVVRNAPPASTPDLGKRAGMSDAAILKATGRDWKQWLALLDRAGAREMPHREIVRRVSSLGVRDWWSQMVTVGYERIRGLRERGQRRDRAGSFEATKSRTFAVPIEVLFEAFADPRKRHRWLPERFTIRRATANKSMRITWPDGTNVDAGFFSKGRDKSYVAVAHGKLPDRAAAAAAKKAWSERFDRLGELLG